MSYGYGTTVPDPFWPRRTAPTSVRVLATVQYLGALGLLAVAGLITLVAFGGARYVPPPLTVPPDLPAAGLYGGIGLVVFVLGRKLHRGRQWARVFVLAVSAVAASATLYDGLAGTGANTNVLLGLVCPVVYLVLLNTPAARAWFSARGAAVVPSGTAAPWARSPR